MFPDIFIILCRKTKTQPDSSRNQQVWDPSEDIIFHSKYFSFDDKLKSALLL